MINLLPYNQKKNLLEQRKVKQVVILGIAVLASLICLILIMLFMKLDLQGSLVLEKQLFNCDKEDCDSEEIELLEQEANYLKEIFSKTITYYQEKEYLIEKIEDFYQAIPENIILTNISFKKNNREVSLSGYSPDRDSLIKFKQDLENKDNFEKIYFPSSNWMNSQDINFLVSFRIKK